MPRTLHRIYAKVMGYFWLPCPICGKYFGGHEVKKTPVAVHHTKYAGTLVCSNPQCAYSAGVISQAKGFAILPKAVREKWS